MMPPGARVAVIGAGVTGALCARLLAQAGLAVHVFDKSRGLGGRMATRRVNLNGPDGTPYCARFDHGAFGFEATAPEFVQGLESAERAGLLTRWSPRVAGRPVAQSHPPTFWLPTPDMPAWCRALLADVSVHTGCTLDALRRGPGGWSLEQAGTTVAEGFDAVIVAIPPEQAAVLVQPHQSLWAQAAAGVSMAPSWVLMAMTDDPQPEPPWDVAQPSTGPLAWVVRQDAKPGRERQPGWAHWVVHATTAWSQAHLEAPAAEVQTALQAALETWLGRTLTWTWATVHRWRYATGAANTPCATAAHDHHPDAVAPLQINDRLCAWDSVAGLGMCGDAWGGGGVEGAWRSAQALVALINHPGLAPDAPVFGHVPLARPS